MIRRAVVLAAAVALVAGCESLTVENPFNLAPVAVRIDASTASPVVLARGQSLVVSLEADVTTGYRWEVVQGFSPTLLQVGTADYVARSTEAGVVGAPGEMIFRFRAETVGTTALEFVYRRPFEPNVAPAKTVHYDVTVR